MQPLSVVENAGFKQLMHTAEPRFKIPSRPYFTNTVIPAMYTRKRVKTENVLSSVQYCSVTTDIRTAQHSTRSYISLTVHCVTSSWELASYCLSTKELPGEHTATNISTAIQEMLNDWNIDTEKVVAVVTDNARNMVNAISELDLFNFPCIGHTLQLGVKKSFDVPKVHTTLARVGRLVAHFHRSPKSMSKLREKQKLLGLPEHQLINDCITRWGSTYEMLKRFLEQQQAICAMLLEDGDNRTLMPSTDEIATMEELVEILKHFYQATEILSGELYPTIGVVFPILNRFLTVLLVSDSNDKDVAKKIKEKIKQDLVTRYQSDEIENVLFISMYLDPRFKLLSMLTEQQKRAVQSAVKVELTTTILHEREKNQETEQIASQSESTIHSEQLEQPQPKRTKLEKFFDSAFRPRAGENSSASEVAATELQRYELEEPLGLENKQPLLWWKERELLYKYLSLLSKKFLCITATSVPSERLFSSAGNLVAEKRSRLTSDNIDKLIFLYENKTL